MTQPHSDTNRNELGSRTPLHLTISQSRTEIVAQLQEAGSRKLLLEIEGRQWIVAGFSDLPNYVPEGFVLFTLQEVTTPAAVPFDPWKEGQA